MTRSLKRSTSSRCGHLLAMTKGMMAGRRAAGKEWLEARKAAGRIHIASYKTEASCRGIESARTRESNARRGLGVGSDYPRHNGAYSDVLPHVQWAFGTRHIL